MDIYEKWNSDRTECLSIIIDPDATKLAKMADKDYLLVMEQSPDPATHKLGDMTFVSGTPFGVRSWKVATLTQTEKDAYTAQQLSVTVAAANEVLLEEIELSGNMDVWSNQTDQEVIEFFATHPETVPALIATNRKIARALTDVIKKIDLWQETGRIV